MPKRKRPSKRGQAPKKKSRKTNPRFTPKKRKAIVRKATKRKVSKPLRKKASTRKAAKRKVPQKKRKRTPSLEKRVTEHFSGRKFRQIRVERYKRTKKHPHRANTKHETYSASLDLAELREFLSGFPDNLSIQLRLVFKDDDDILHVRSTPRVSIDEPELAIEYLFTMLREYRIAKDLAEIVDVHVDVWGELQGKLWK